MFDASILNVVIGLVLIYLLYSLLVTALQEILSTLFQRRAHMLYHGIRSMLSDTASPNSLPYRVAHSLAEWWRRFSNGFVSFFKGRSNATTLYEHFFDHPIIKGYGQNRLFNKPSYLTASNFSTILIDSIKALDPDRSLDPETFDLIRNNVYSYSQLPEDLRERLTPGHPNPPDAAIDFETFKILQYHLTESGGDLNVFRFRIERWFNDTMDRVSGWYKRNTQAWLLLIGLVLGIGFNLDTIAITNILSTNKEAARRLADMGVAAASNPKYSGNDSITNEVYDSLKAELHQVNTIVGLGWGDYGVSDPAFRTQLLQRKPRLQAPYDSLVKLATAHYDSSMQAFTALRDSALATHDTATFKKYASEIDQLKKNEEKIKTESSFAALYEIKHAPSKTNYVFYYIGRHPKKWLGFLITAVALSLGAPFWFDLLNKFVSLRTAVKTVDSSGSTTPNNAVDNHEIDG